MEYNSEDIIGNIYTSYGPAIGKVCQNTTKLLNDNNFDNSLTSSVVELLSGSSSNNNIDYISSQNPKNIIGPNTLKNIDINQQPNLANLPNLPNLPNNISENFQNNPSVNLPIEKSVKFSKNKTNASVTQPNVNSKNLKSIKTINTNNNVNNTNNNVNNTNTEENKISESSSIFNYKVSIFNYKISIWILILILIVVLCIGYFIYKYCYSSNNFVSYIKNDSNSQTSSNNIKKNNIGSKIKHSSNSDSMSNSNISKSTNTDTTTNSNSTNSNSTNSNSTNSNSTNSVINLSKSTK